MNAAKGKRVPAKSVPERAKRGDPEVVGKPGPYKPLPIKIIQNGGHHYSQVWRDDYAAVYDQRNGFGAFLGYEAIAIKRAEPCYAFGKDYPARELYPCAEDWGTLAISTSDLDRAMDTAKHFSLRAKQNRNRKACQDGSKVPLRHQQKTVSAGSLVDSEGQTDFDEPDGTAEDSRHTV